MNLPPPDGRSWITGKKQRPDTGLTETAEIGCSIDFIQNRVSLSGFIKNRVSGIQHHLKKVNGDSPLILGGSDLRTKNICYLAMSAIFSSASTDGCRECCPP